MSMTKGLNLMLKFSLQESVFAGHHANQAAKIFENQTTGNILNSPRWQEALAAIPAPAADLSKLELEDANGVLSSLPCSQLAMRKDLVSFIEVAKHDMLLRQIDQSLERPEQVTFDNRDSFFFLDG